MGKAINLLGQKFGKLTVTELIKIPGKERRWKCVCNCGNVVYVSTENLRSGNSKSCGCSRNESNKKRGIHFMTNTKTYEYWVELIKYKNKNKKQICDEWLNFSIFFSDMGEKPDKQVLSLRDVEKPYSKENCFWCEKELAEIVHPNSVIIRFNNESHTITWWSKKFNISASTLSKRYKNGITPPELFQKTIRTKNINTSKRAKKPTGRPRDLTKWFLDKSGKYYFANVSNKKIMISKEDIEKVNKFHWIVNKNNYVETHVTIHGKYKRILLHRLILDVCDIDWRSSIIDHINENTLDNRRCNLRFCSNSENQHNRSKLRKDNSSGYVGICREGNGWRCSLDGKYLGHFSRFEEAVARRKEAETEEYGNVLPASRKI